MHALNGSNATEAVFPPHSWDKLDDWLHRLSTALQDTPRPALAEGGFPIDAEKAQLLIKGLDETHVAEITKCIYDLVKCGNISFEQYSSECLGLLKIRLIATSSLVSTVGLATGSPILYPQESRKFLEWLLTDWWQEQGVVEAAYALATEDWP